MSEREQDRQHDDTIPLVAGDATDATDATDTTRPEPTLVADREVEERPREGGSHPVHVAHLVMGIALTLLVVVWALVTFDVVQGRDVRWLLPLPWLAAGAAGLVATTVRGRAKMAR